MDVNETESSRTLLEEFASEVNDSEPVRASLNTVLQSHKTSNEFQQRVNRIRVNF